MSFRRAIELSARDWLYLAVATKELAVARCRFALEPTSRIITSLHCPSHSSAKTVARGTLELTQFAWALASAARRTPFRSDCLIQVMAADRWLRRQDRHADFFLGVNTNLDGRFAAHAWLKCEGVVVAGGDVSSFRTLIEPANSALDL